MPCCQLQPDGLYRRTACRFEDRDGATPGLVVDGPWDLRYPATISIVDNGVLLGRRSLGRPRPHPSHRCDSLRCGLSGGGVPALAGAQIV
jgi:hypothetical protein